MAEPVPDPESWTAVPPAWPSDPPLPYAEAVRRTTPNRLRGPRYHRLLPDVYLPADVEVVLAHRIAAWRTKLPHAVLAGPTAAYVLGVPWFEDAAEVEVIQEVPRRTRVVSGLRVRGDGLTADDVVGSAFGPVTSPARTAYDLARRWPLARATASLDAVLRATGITVDDVRRVVDANAGARDVRLARLALLLADPRAESPPETWLRVALIEAGMIPPTPQFLVRGSAGRPLARLDLAVPELRLGIEYDGQQHRGRERFGRDLRRHNDLIAEGWTVVRVDAAQLADVDQVVRRLRRRFPPAFPAIRRPASAAVAEFLEERGRRRRTRRPL